MEVPRGHDDRDQGSTTTDRRHLQPRPDEWLATFADPVRAQAAVDQFTSNAYDLVIDGESYRSRQKPTLSRPPKLDPGGQPEPRSPSSRRRIPGGMVVRNRGPMLVRADKIRADLTGPGSPAMMAG